MQATITYLLTEQAQRAQMAATGQPVERKQTTTFEIPNEDINLYKVREDGSLYFEISEYKKQEKPIASAAEFRALLESDHAVWEIKVFDKWDETPGSNWIYIDRDYQASYSYFDSPIDEDTHIRSAALRERVDEIRARKDAEAAAEAEKKAEEKARCEAETAARKAAEAAKEEAKTAYIARWVKNQSDEELKQQFADGLADRQDLLTLIANEAFGNVPGEIDDVKICEDPDCPCGSKAVDALPKAEYRVWRAMKAKLPEGAGVQFHRVRECEGWDGEGEAADPTFYTAEITLPVGPFKFVRTVEL